MPSLRGIPPSAFPRWRAKYGVDDPFGANCLAPFQSRLSGAYCTGLPVHCQDERKWVVTQFEILFL